MSKVTMLLIAAVLLFIAPDANAGTYTTPGNSMQVQPQFLGHKLAQWRRLELGCPGEEVPHDFRLCEIRRRVERQCLGTADKGSWFLRGQSVQVRRDKSCCAQHY